MLDGSTAGNEAKTWRIALEKIKPNRFQPRRIFNEELLAELAESMRENGLLQPIILRPLPEAADEFELIAGERRLRAAQMLNWQSIEAIVRGYSHTQSMQLALIENIQRADLNIIEEALALKELVLKCGLSHEQVAQKIGKSRSAVTNILRLLRLPPAVQTMLVNKTLNMGQVRPLLGLEDMHIQEQLAETIVTQAWTARVVEQKLKSLAEKKIPSGSESQRFINSIEQELIEVLQTKVRIEGSQEQGTLTIAYYSLTDLEKLLSLLNPDKYGGS